MLTLAAAPAPSPPIPTRFADHVESPMFSIACRLAALRMTLADAGAWRSAKTVDEIEGELLKIMVRP